MAHLSSRLRYFRKYHCTKRMARYRLAQPTPLAVEGYVKSVKANLLANGEVKSKLKEVMKSRCGGLASPHLTRKDLEMTVGRLAAQRLLTKALQVRKRNAGLLLDSLKRIRLHDPKDFGKGCHSRHSEPYFYEAAYQPVVRDSPIPINERGECVVATEIPCDHSKPKGSVCSKLNGTVQKGDMQECVESESIQCEMWECHSECKPLSDSEIDTILSFRAAFDLSVEEARQALAKCDYGCPYGHYTKCREFMLQDCVDCVDCVGFSTVELKGHPIVCHTGDCSSTLRILGVASTHLPVLRKLLPYVTDAVSCHNVVHDIDNALHCGNYQYLMKLLDVETV